MSTKKKNWATSTFDPFKSSPNITRTTIIENMYMRILTEWAATRFKWNGLPDTVDPRFLENELFYKAMILFYNDYRYDRFMAVRGTIQGPMNMYDNPTRFRTTGIATYAGINLSSKECVPIWASYTRIPARDIVLIYAKRLAELDTSLDLNAKAMRHNKVVEAEEGQRLSMTNILKQQEEGSVIFVTPGANMEQSLSVLDLGVNPQNLSALRQEKNEVWNECMTLMGITSANQNKKERLVAAEATGADGQVLAARNAEMKPRQEACEQINALFGLNVSVEWDLDQDIAPDVGESPSEDDDIDGDENEERA